MGYIFLSSYSEYYWGLAPRHGAALEYSELSWVVSYLLFMVYYSYMEKDDVEQSTSEGNACVQLIKRNINKLDQDWINILH